MINICCVRLPPCQSPKLVLRLMTDKKLLLKKFFKNEILPVNTDGYFFTGEARNPERKIILNCE